MIDSSVIRFDSSGSVSNAFCRVLGIIGVFGVAVALLI
jgi:hypothetical protein